MARLESSHGRATKFKTSFPLGTLSDKKKAHEHHVFGLVALGTSPGLFWGQVQFVPGTNPGFLFDFTHWKPSLCQGQTQFVPGTNPGRRVAEKVYVLKIYVPFSLTKLTGFFYP